MGGARAGGARAGRTPGTASGKGPRRISAFWPASGSGTTASRSSGPAWSPRTARYDEAAIDRYRAICDAARAAGITPWVNFFHFTHPAWFAERGGFLEPANHADFLRYVEKLGRALAPHARHFHTQNESMVYVMCCYSIGLFPPFVADAEKGFTMARHVLALHARGYEILKAIDQRNVVATIEVYLDFQPASPGGTVQRAAAAEIDRWYHAALLDALATGWVRLPGREPEEMPGLRGALDVYGFNYYHSNAAGGAPGPLHSDFADPPIDAMGRAVNPAGMERGLARVAAALPGVPILVTENGCPTLDEDFRIRYIASHLGAIDRARAGGTPVGGYFHWTAVDNYEWLEGFSDKRFGLIGFDPATKERRLKKSARWLADVIRAGRLDPAALP